MTKGITFNDKKSAQEFARQFSHAEIKKVGFWRFAKYIVYVNESALKAENYKRQLRGLPNIEDEAKEGNK